MNEAGNCLAQGQGKIEGGADARPARDRVSAGGFELRSGATMDGKGTRLGHVARRGWRILLWVVVVCVVVLAGLYAWGDYELRTRVDPECQKDIAAAQSMAQQATDSQSDPRLVSSIHDTIRQMQDACARHDVKTARALAMRIAFGLALSTDGAKPKPAAPDSAQ